MEEPEEPPVHTSSCYGRAAGLPRSGLNGGAPVSRALFGRVPVPCPPLPGQPNLAGHVAVFLSWLLKPTEVSEALAEERGCTLLWGKEHVRARTNGLS